jgi:hypothetical protein
MENQRAELEHLLVEVDRLENEQRALSVVIAEHHRRIGLLRHHLAGASTSSTLAQQMPASPSRVLFVGDFPGRLAATLRDLGLAATQVSSIAEVERWPTKAIVITDPAHYTRLWRDYGAARVLMVGDGDVLAGEPRDVDVWIRGTDAIGALLTLVVKYDAEHVRTVEQ